MNRWLPRIVIAAALLGALYGLLFEAVTRVGRGWLFDEPFYEGRPASYWASEIERWETEDPDWRDQTYVRPSAWPSWVQKKLGEPRWPGLLDGDPDGLPVLQWLSKYPSPEVQDWARIGIERLDNLRRGPYKIARRDVIFTAEVYEVDEALYEKIATGPWRSMAELEKLESAWLGQAEKKQMDESLFDLLGKQKPLMSVKNIKIADGKEGPLLSSTKEIACLPTPLQVRKGQTGPQKIEEGLTFRVYVRISRDRRFVRLKLSEKISTLVGIDKVKVTIDQTGREAPAEIACVKESAFTTPRTVPDGGGLVFPLQFRPLAAKENGRWLVMRITPRIYIEEEERQK